MTESAARLNGRPGVWIATLVVMMSALLLACGAPAAANPQPTAKIRVSALYPNQPGGKFDTNYFLNKHMALVHQRLDSLGLVRTEVDKGLATAQPGSPAPFIMVAHLYFKSMEDFQKAFGAHGAELIADGRNYTDIQPQIQISEIVQ